jgi:hypothetical protein
MAFRKRKNKTDLPPPPSGLPLPPPPSGLPLPPAPAGDLPPLPTPPPEPTPVADMSKIPAPPEPPKVAIEAGEISVETDADVESDESLIDDDVVEVVLDDEPKDENYADLWQNRTEKSLQQMYGHIDRLGSGEVGTLLERYSDRFGHELDREIIVMRKSEREGLREAAPVVELISTPDDVPADEEESEEMEELRQELSDLESEMRPLKNQFDAAKQKGKKSQVQKLGKQLRPLASRRKLIKSVLAGDEDISVLESDESEPEAAVDEDNFPAFFDVVNTLLGDMPDDFVNKFISSKNFPLFEKVGEDPSGTSTKLRKQFFKMVNNELGDMPDKQLQSFMESTDFQLFIAMSEIYGA